MVIEDGYNGLGVVKYGRKMIGATKPQESRSQGGYEAAWQLWWAGEVPLKRLIGIESVQRSCFI